MEDSEKDDGFLNNLDEARGKYIAVFITIEEGLREIIAAALADSEKSRDRIYRTLLSQIGSRQIIYIFADLYSTASSESDSKILIDRLMKFNSYRNKFAHNAMLPTFPGFSFVQENKFSGPPLDLHRGESYGEKWFFDTMIEMMALANELHEKKADLADKIRYAIDKYYDF